MDKILKQSFWSTLVIYFGVLLGFINSIILFPKFLSTEQIGLFRQIISASTILIPLTTFGVSSSYVKFYPLFKKDFNQKNQFFSLNLILIFGAYLLVGSLLYIFFEEIESIFSQKSELFIEYFYVVYYILFLMSLSALFESYLRARYNTILSNVLNGVSNRILTSLSIILLAYSFIDFKEVIHLQILIYSLGLLIILIYSNSIDKLYFTIKIDKIKTSLSRILNYNSYSFLGSFSNIIVLNVDILMVTTLLGLSQTGIYTTAFYIGMIIEIPRRAISQISLPVISDNIKDDDFTKIEDNYKEVSLHQTLIGVLFYLIIIINIENIYSLIPNSSSFIEGKNVVYIVGLTKLLIMMFGYSSELISISKFYRFTVTTIIILAVLVIALNLLLIPKFGMMGAALASLISILIYNIIKYLFIKIKMGITPFSVSTLKIILIGIVLYIIFYLIPGIKNNILDIILKTSVISGFYILIIYKLRLSKKFNNIILRLFRN